MNNINGINGYQGPPAIPPTNGNGSHAAQPETKVEEGGDQVEISSIAQYMQKIAMMPEIRAGKVAQMKQALGEGNYEVESKLETTLDKFIQENMQE